MAADGAVGPVRARFAGKFTRAGVELFGYVVTFSDDFTDAEIERAFQFARALGVGVIGTNQTRLTMGPAGWSHSRRTMASRSAGTTTPT